MNKKTWDNIVIEAIYTDRDGVFYEGENGVSDITAVYIDGSLYFRVIEDGETIYVQSSHVVNIVAED